MDACAQVSENNNRKLNETEIRILEIIKRKTGIFIQLDSIAIRTRNCRLSGRNDIVTCECECEYEFPFHCASPAACCLCRCHWRCCYALFCGRQKQRSAFNNWAALSGRGEQGGGRGLRAWWVRSQQQRLDLAFYFAAKQNVAKDAESNAQSACVLMQRPRSQQRQWQKQQPTCLLRRFIFNFNK